MQWTNPSPLEAGLTADLRQAVRDEHKQLQDWMAEWCKQQHKLLVEQGQLLQQVVAQRDAKPVPPLQRPESCQLGRVRSCGARPTTQRSCPPTERKNSPSTTSLGEDDVADFAGILPAAWAERAGGTRSSSPASPRLFCAKETTQPDLPNAVHFTETDGERNEEMVVARKPKPRPTLSRSYTREEMEQTASEDARAQWAEHLRVRVTQQLGNHRRTRRKALPLPNISWCIESGSLCSGFITVSVGRLVRSNAFQWYCGAVVVLNTIFTGYVMNVCIERALAIPPDEAPAWFEDVNRSFNALYCIELVLRLIAFGRMFFTGPDRKWHAFDSIIVFMSLAEEMVQGVEMNIDSLRVIRVLRMFRVLRIIRVMRYFRDLRLMLCSIMQSLGALSWALLLLLIIMYLFTVVFMQACIQYLQEPEANEEDHFIRDGVDLWYGSLVSTMYTLLASIVGGVSWVDVVRPLEKISMVYRFLFTFYVIFVVIGVLNVLTGIFVERACELSGLDRDLVIQAQMMRDENFLLEMKRIFEEADVDGSQTINWEEFKTYLENDRVKAYLSTQQLDAFDARTLFEMLKEEGSDDIPIETFIVGCQRLKGLARGVDVVAVLQETRSMSRRLKLLERKMESTTASADIGQTPSASTVSGL